MRTLKISARTPFHPIRCHAAFTLITFQHVTVRIKRVRGLITKKAILRNFKNIKTKKRHLEEKLCSSGNSSITCMYLAYKMDFQLSHKVVAFTYLLNLTTRDGKFYFYGKRERLDCPNSARNVEYTFI